MSHIISETTNAKIFTHDLGGQGRPILFVHAATLNGTTWLPIAEELKNNFHCFAVDIRGHGLSQIADSLNLSWSELADDLNFVVNDIKQACNLSSEEKLLGCGHSLGGALLLFSEAKNQSFDKLWLFEPVMFGRDDQKIRVRTEQMIEAAQRRKPEFASREDAIERYRSKFPFMFFNSQALDEYIKYGLTDIDEEGKTVRLSCKPQDEIHIYKTANSGVTEILEQVKIPVKVIVGEDDQDRVTSIFNTTLPTNFELEQFETMSHFGVQTHPSLISKDIEDFFS